MLSIGLLKRRVIYLSCRVCFMEGVVTLDPLCDDLYIEDLSSPFLQPPLFYSPHLFHLSTPFSFSLSVL